MDDVMEHPRIDDDKMVDRYLAGELSAEDEARFEEHLFECEGCLEKVQWGEELRRGLQAVAAEDAARATVSLGLLARLRSRPAQLTGLAALALAFVGLAFVVLWQQAELVRARADAGFTQPVDDFLVVSLGVVRDAGGERVEIRPDPNTEAVLLSLELQTVDADRYRVTLHGADEVLWIGEDLEPNLYDTLLVALPSAFLLPKDYRITVDALSASGVEPAGEMELRVLP